VRSCSSCRCTEAASPATKEGFEDLRGAAFGGSRTPLLVKESDWLPAFDTTSGSAETRVEVADCSAANWSSEMLLRKDAVPGWGAAVR